MTSVITTSNVANTDIVAVDGDLDWRSVPKFRNAIAGISVQRAVLVDLRRVGHIDSSGTGALIDAWLHCQHANVRSAIAVSDTDTRALLDFVRMNDVEPILTGDDAIADWLSTEPATTLG
jgi:anti-anti-sigma factor